MPTVEVPRRMTPTYYRHYYLNKICLASANLKNFFDMTRFSGKNRRESTIIRDNNVHKLYHDLCLELGNVSTVVSKQYIYERISEKIGLGRQTIAFILNHTKPTKK
jgi:hypothetical protein